MRIQREFLTISINPTLPKDTAELLHLLEDGWEIISSCCFNAESANPSIFYILGRENRWDGDKVPANQ